jgi:hypothetical protein
MNEPASVGGHLLVLGLAITFARSGSLRRRVFRGGAGLGRRGSGASKNARALRLSLGVPSRRAQSKYPASQDAAMRGDPVRLNWILPTLCQMNELTYGSRAATAFTSS